MSKLIEVKMRTVYASPTGHCDAGKTIKLPEVEARSIVAAGYAEFVEAADAAEKEPLVGKASKAKE